MQEEDSQVRKTFAISFLTQMVVDVGWPWYILWSDEAHFFLNGQVKTHKC